MNEALLGLALFTTGAAVGAGVTHYATRIAISRERIRLAALLAADESGEDVMESEIMRAAVNAVRAEKKGLLKT